MIAGEASISSIRNSESKFISEGHNKILLVLNRVFCPRRDREGVTTLGGTLYWMKCIWAMDAFVRNKSEYSLIYALSVPIWAKYPLMRNKKLEAARQCPSSKPNKIYSLKNETKKKKRIFRSGNSLRRRRRLVDRISGSYYFRRPRRKEYGSSCKQFV